MLNVARLKSDARLQVPAAIVTVAVMIALPALVHLLPPVNGISWGLRLLPLFYGPFLAALLFHPAVSIIAGFVTPLLNYGLTGSPPYEIAVVLSFELVVFSAIVLIVERRRPKFPLVAPIALILAKAISSIALLVTTFSIGGWSYFSNSLQVSWPALIVLAVLNLLTVRYLYGSD
jgi:hypothetical protein